MKRILTFFITLISIIALHAEVKQYIWPTNAPKLLSGTFGEPRAGHFHSGIDIKTWAQSGYECYALDNGYIQRVRISPFGYGKVIYLQLDDGNMAVYAHLDRFHGRLKEVVRELQLKTHSSIVDTTFPPEGIRVRKGNVIAFTGGSGTQYPHLHFEIRDTSGAVMNPLTHGLTIEDPDVPIIEKIGFTPLNDTSTVMGEHRSQVFDVRLGDKKIYELVDTIQASGLIGVELSAYDRAVTTNKNAPYQVDMYVQGKALFKSVYDRFRLENSGLIDLEKNFMLNRDSENNFQSLYYTNISEQLGFFDEKLNGRIQIQPGYQTLVLQVRDANNNRSSVRAVVWGGSYPEYPFDSEEVNGEFIIHIDSSFTVLKPATMTIQFFNGYGHFLSEKQLSGETIRKDLHFQRSALEGNILSMVFRDENGFTSHPKLFYFNTHSVKNEPVFNLKVRHYPQHLLFEISSPDFLASELMLGSGGDQWRILPLQHISQRVALSYPLRLDDCASLEQIALFRKDSLTWVTQWEMKPLIIEHSQRGRLLSDDSLFGVIYPEYAFYHPKVAVWMDVLDAPENPDGGIIQSSMYRLYPDDQPVRNRYSIALRCSELLPEPEKAGIYSWDPSKNKWSYEGGEYSKGKTIYYQANIAHSGYFALVRDQQAPEFKTSFPENGGTYRVSKLRRAWTEISDKLSGFGSGQSFEIIVDGHWVPYYYNGVTKVIEVDNVNWLPGSHRIEWNIRDLAGYSNSKVIKFTVIQ